MRRRKVLIAGFVVTLVVATCGFPVLVAASHVSRLVAIADSLCLPRLYLLQNWVRGRIEVHASHIGNMESYCFVAPYRAQGGVEWCPDSRFDRGDSDSASGCIEEALKFRNGCDDVLISYGKVWQRGGVLYREGVQLCGGRFLYSYYQYDSSGA